MGRGGCSLRTISQLIQHTNQPLAHYAHTVKLINGAKHTISQSKFGDRAPSSLCQNPSVIQLFNPLLHPDHQARTQQPQTGARLFVLTDSPPRSLMDADSYDAFISPYPLPKKKERNLRMQTPMVKHERVEIF